MLPGNTNTYTIVDQKLDPPIVASKVRFLPYSDHVRTVCMRVELLGCKWTGSWKIVCKCNFVYRISPFIGNARGGAVFVYRHDDVIDASECLQTESEFFKGFQTLGKSSKIVKQCKEIRSTRFDYGRINVFQTVFSAIPYHRVSAEERNWT